MRAQTPHVVVGLIAAVCFALAFIAAGAVLLSGLFMVAGLLAVGWLAWRLIRRVRLWGHIKGERQRRQQDVV
ncbi:MAG: hypothetical protein EON90_03820 [Brevundimonas sp.]|nr:MAG: hypothetical protein EON90_03820 [Brevundimonas sp.]